jgi:acyl-CoA reductase-like NAD-dependent aldehyde dehydrogenase
MTDLAGEVGGLMTVDHLRPFINGTFQDPLGSDELTLINPATGRPIAALPLANAGDIDQAVTAARNAQRGWRQTPGATRAALLHRLADLIERDAQLLAQIEALDVGKPVGQPLMVDVPMSVATLRYMAGFADRITGTVVPAPAPTGRPTHSYVNHVPVGVVGAIVPWNTPLMIAVWKVATAICSGNTIVLKPAEVAPLSVLHLAALVAEAGFPPGVVNIVTGTGPEAGEALVRHPGVDKLSFTGSGTIGRRILALAAERMCPVTLELGGKSPHIVLADADVERAVGATAMGLFFNSGQVCAAGTRVLVHRSVHDQFVEALVGAAEAQTIGDPFAPTTTMGPLVSATQRDRVVEWIGRGEADGATRQTGGAVEGDGFFVRPTILTDVTPDMGVARHEIFGPVGVVIPFDDPAEALSMANDTDYGLTASVWTRDVTAALLLAEEVEAGTVWVNGWGGLHPGLPWGGMKQSGMGRELGWGGVLSYTEEKVISVYL